MAGAILDSAAALFTAVPFEVQLGGHCLTVAHLCKRKFENKFALNCVVGFVFAFGGGLVTSLLLQSAKAPLSFLAGDTIPVFWVAAWWLMMHCPGGVVSSLFELRAVQGLAFACLAMLRSGIMIQRIDLTRALHPGTMAGPWLMGVLGGCAGGMLVDAIEAGSGSSKQLSELASPGYPLWSAALVSTFHLATVHWWGMLTSFQSLGLVQSLLVAHVVGSTMVGGSLDWTRPAAALFHALTRIPVPPPKRGGGPVTRAKAQVGQAAPAKAAPIPAKEKKQEAVPAAKPAPAPSAPPAPSSKAMPEPAREAQASRAKSAAPKATEAFKAPASKPKAKVGRSTSSEGKEALWNAEADGFTLVRRKKGVKVGK